MQGVRGGVSGGGRTVSLYDGPFLQGIDATMGDKLPVIMMVLFSGYGCHDGRLLCSPGRIAWGGDKIGDET